jgi:Protein of unknown function (DUF3800)
VIIPTAMRDLAAIVLPWGAQDGAILMLTVYFDDSGTHGTSDVVVVGGLLGNQYQWQFFNELWAAKLGEPSPGKLPLRRFHMYDCVQGENEFLGWSRTATDFLVHELGTIILKTGLYGYACAIARKDWNDLVTGDWRDAFGDAEGFCVRQCYLEAMRMCAVLWQKDLAIVFDDRPHRYPENKKIFDLFKHPAADEFANLHSLTFASAARVLPLQGADLIAWETYQQARAFLLHEIDRDEFYRKELKRLATSGRMRLQYASRNQIERLFRLPLDKDKLPIVADYFTSDSFSLASAE